MPIFAYYILIIGIKYNVISNLPAAQIADTVNKRLQEVSSLVITAPPGAGKSTLLPLTILEGINSIKANGGSCASKILMLEPRRLAARQIAERMASMIGEPVGKTIGYRVRFDSCVSKDTRIEVLTEGILTRMLIDNPTLDDVAVVIFDEFHERSLNSDLALALTRESQSIIRPDVKIVVMSATIDASAICASLNAPLIESNGRMFPVDIHHIETDINETSRPEEIAKEVVKAIISAHSQEDGDILAFLPGQAEITKCCELLNGQLGETNIYPLYGLLSPQQQRNAIAPSRNGERKVVLATPIAETSITIEGVRIVIDSGLCRRLVFTPQNALSHLTTVRISMDMANQRTGRAGRVQSGTCYRLWSIATEHRMEECRKPEILEADLSPMMLDIAAWGESDVTQMSWLTSPPLAHVSQAKNLLKMLGAIDEQGKLTAHGKELSALPCHPRIAQMLVSASSAKEKSLAADIAAMLEEKDPLADRNDADINSRIIALRSTRSKRPKQKEGSQSHNNDILYKPGPFTIINRISEQYHKIAKVKIEDEQPNPYDTGKLLALAYPERIAKANEEGCGKFRLANGEFTYVETNDNLSACEWLSVASLGKRIFLASPLHPEDVREMMQVKKNLSWDNKQKKVIARSERRIGSIIVNTNPLEDVSNEDIINTLCEAAPKYGTSMFDFNEKVLNLQRRISLVDEWHPELELPDVRTESILVRAKDWLLTTDFKKVELVSSIWSLLTYEQQQAIDKLAPPHITVPTGSKIKVEYRQGAEQPILRVRLQECFGMKDTPRIDNGKKPVLMELLSPGFKPVQLTQDLHSFWEETYFEVRKELRRRYPKHSWPDNPLEAIAVRGVKRN